MKRLLLVADPIGGANSVQFEILDSLAHGLGSRYHFTVYSPHIDPESAEVLAQKGCQLITPNGHGFAFNRFLQARGSHNESMLWAESWMQEALLQRNTQDASNFVNGDQFDYTVNLSMTVPVDSDLWWILGTPLDQTIRGMASANPVAWITDLFGGRLLASLDSNVTSRIQSQTRRIVANSPYLKDLYRQRGTAVEGVVYTLKDMSEFQPSSEPPLRDYVLLYVGKETDALDFRSMLNSGVRIIGFGSKIPTGTRLQRFTQSIEWLGRVTKRKLVELYSNALFTLFPFTVEPMGLVPIESMACGTPVLTYDRQGPACTVVNGSTGWLVNTREEMVSKAKEIWRRGETGISRDACVRRAQDFCGERMATELTDWIEGACPIVPVTAHTLGSRLGFEHEHARAMEHA